MQSQNPLNTADPEQARAARLAYSQGMSEAAMSALPGAGAFGAVGYSPEYGENYGIPTGFKKGPSIKENIDRGEYTDAGLQAFGLVGDLGWVAGAASKVPMSQQRGGTSVFAPAERGMVKLTDDLPMDEASRMGRAAPKYKPKIVDGSTFPDPDTQKGRMAIQGGPLAAKPGIDRLITTLDSHGMDWKYSENGGITAYAEVRGPDGKWFKEGKHFDEKSSLKTLRDWLGY